MLVENDVPTIRGVLLKTIQDDDFGELLAVAHVWLAPDVDHSHPVLRRARARCPRLKNAVPVYVSPQTVAAVELDTVLVMDVTEEKRGKERWLSAQSVVCIEPWQKKTQALGHQCLPLHPKGWECDLPFTLYSGHVRVPGLLDHGAAVLRDGTPCNRGRGRALVAFMQLRQWRGQNDAPRRVAIALHQEHCNRLPGPGLTPDAAEWNAVIEQHAIPFYAVCCVNPSSKPDLMLFDVLAIQWELLPYLEQHALQVSAAAAQSLIENTKKKQKSNSGGGEDDIISLTCTGQMPKKHHKWRYYVLGSAPDTILDEATLLDRHAHGTCRVIVLAARRKVSKIEPTTIV